MALKEFDGELDSPEDTGTFKPFDGSLDDDARQPLTEGVKPSNAGAGRGSTAVQVKGARDKTVVEAAKVKTPPVKPFVGGDERTVFVPGDAGGGRGLVNPGDEQTDRRAFTPGQVGKDLEGGVEQVKALGTGAAAFGGAVDYRAIGNALKDFDAIDAGQAPSAPAAARVYGQGGTGTNPVAQAYAQATPEQRAQLRTGATQSLMRDQNFINDSVNAIKGFNAEQQKLSGTIPNFTDIKTKNDFVEWAVRNGVATAPTMAVSMISALAGVPGLMAASGAMAVGDMTSSRATTAAQEFDPKRFTSADRAADALAAQPEQTARHLAENVGTTAALAVPYAALDYLGPAGTLASGGAKGLAKKGAVAIARKGLKEAGEEAINEGGQEIVNVGSDMAANERPAVWTSDDSKRVFNSATVGSLMGAAGHASNVAGDAVKGMAKDQRTRSELERRANGGDIEAAMTLVAIEKGVMRPSELRGQSVSHFEDVAATHGLPDEAIKATKAEIAGSATKPAMPVEEIPGFLSRAMKAFDKRGLLGKPLPKVEPAPQTEADAVAPDVSREASAETIESKLEDRLAGTLGIQMDPIDEAAHKAATSPTNDLPEPTPAQKEAGNYKVGRVRISGMNVSIENPMGSVRKSKDDSDPWEVTMPAHYGYIRGTEGSDGDHVDLFIGGAGDNGRFWVVNQHHAGTPDKFDEHKVVTGVDSPEQAVELYKKSFADNYGDKVFSSVSTEFNADQIKQRLPAMRKPKPVTRPARTVPSAEAQTQPDVGAMVDAGQTSASSAQPVSGVQAPAPAAGFAATPTKETHGLQSTEELPGAAQNDGAQATRTAPGPDRVGQSRQDQHRPNGRADGRTQAGVEHSAENQPLGQGSNARLIANAGRTPNATEPIKVHTNEDGTLTPHLGKSALVDFDSGEPITLPAGTSDLDIKKAIRAAGAVSKKVNFYPPKGSNVQPTDDASLRGGGTQGQRDNARPGAADQRTGGTPQTQVGANPQEPAAGDASNVGASGTAGQGRKGRQRAAPPLIRGSDALGQISARLKGISPDLLSDLSQKVTRSRTGKTGKKTTYTTYDNPLHQGHGPLFRKGGSGDLSEIARVLEEEGFITPGSDNPESQAQDIIKAELKSGGSTLRAGSAEAVDAEMRRRQEMASDVPDNLMDGLTDDDLAESGYAGASPEVKAATERLMADAEAQGLDTEALREDAARGSDELTEDEYHARLQTALTQAVQAHTQNRAGDGGSEQSGAQASGADRVEAAGDQARAPESGGRSDDGRQGGPDATVQRSEAAPGLTLEAPTRAQVIAQQDALEKERADKEAPADKPKSKLTGEQVDIFNPQRSVFETRSVAAPIFYSDLARQVNASPMKQGTAAAWSQYLDALAKRGAVKSDEIEWTGLREWLAMQEGKVTSKHISEFLDANGVQVTETTLGGKKALPEHLVRALRELTPAEPSGFTASEWLAYSGRFEGIAKRMEKDGDKRDAERMWEASRLAEYEAEKLETDAGNEDGSTKYSRYTLPGGENYREVLLTLPSKGERELGRTEASKASEDIGRFIYARYPTDEGDLETERMLRPSNFDGLTTSARFYEMPGGIDAAQKGDYKSGHWDQPNVLAHIRVNDRTDADGKRVLFVEELQSDFGQDTKKQRGAIKVAVDNDFEGIIKRMQAAGVLEVDCD